MADNDNSSGATPIITAGSDFVKLTLNFHQRQMLNMMAQRGGRTKFTFGTPAWPDPNRDEESNRLAEENARKADDSFRAMSQPPLNLITLIPLVGTANTFEARMTDIGIQVFEQMVAQKPITGHFDLKTGKEIIKP